MIAAAYGTFQYDFAVYDRLGQLSVLLEAKRRARTDSAWAGAWHASAIDRMSHPVTANVVLVALDHIYAWRPESPASAEPDWSLDSRPWLEPYFTRLKIDSNEVDPRVFESIVALWLQDLVRGETPGSDAEPGHGLFETMRGGEVVLQVPA